MKMTLLFLKTDWTRYNFGRRS